MGIIGDVVKAKVIGSEVRKGIEEIKSKKRPVLTCGYCGKKLTEEEVVAACSDYCGEENLNTGEIKFPTLLCKECVRKCKGCNRFFCPEHYSEGLCKQCYKKEYGFFSWGRRKK